MKKIMLCCAVALSSCTTRLYVPNAVNAPLLAERGEVKINLTQNDLQFAFSPANNVGIIANGFFMTRTTKNNYQHRGAMFEAGVGYYTTTSTKLSFEGFVGAGYGNVYKQETVQDANDNDVTASFNATAMKFFIQPDFGFRSRVIDVALTPRIAFLKYGNFSQTNYSEAQLADYKLSGNNLTSGMYVFAEPALTLRAGYKFMKVQLQYGMSLNVTGKQILAPDNFSSIGIVVDIARWYKGED
jgi:hypothetical protein